MKLISEIIEQARKAATQDWQRQESLAKPSNPKWDQAKMYLNDQRPDSLSVIKKSVSSGDNHVHLEKCGVHHNQGKACGDLRRITIIFPDVDDYKMELVAYECSACGIYKAWYALVDTTMSLCYQRFIN